MTHDQPPAARSRALSRRVLGVLMVWGATLVVGCAASLDPPCFPVRGQVLRDGRPLAEAMVVFHPQDETPRPFPRPLGYTDAQGRFELTTFRSGDGAPAGDYAVTVELRRPRQVGEEVVRDGENLLPARFGRPELSSLRCAVSAGENELPAFEIDSP